MATVILLLLVAIAHVDASVFTLCGIFYRDGNCQPGNQCPDGTTEEIQTFFSWPMCNENTICCSGTPTVSSCQNDQMCGEWGPTARLAFSQTQVPRQAPWQVSLRRVTNPSLGMTLQNSLHLAGGVLIHKRWVLTDIMAALSTGRQIETETVLNNMIVVLGEYDISLPEIYNNVPQEQVRTIKSYHFHPGFRYGATSTFSSVLESAGLNAELYQGNSFCLLELAEPVVYNDWVRPICLPTTSGCTDGNNCRVTGWGIDESERLKNLLQVAYLTEFSKPACEAIHYYKNQGVAVTFPDNSKCATNDQSSSSCVGDFGGPLTCDDPSQRNRATLHGIMTTNLVCNQNSTVLISDVSAVVDWVWDTCRAQSRR